MTNKKERSAIQMHYIYQYPDTGTNKKDKFKTVLGFINELQVQDSAVSDDEFNTETRLKLQRCVSLEMIVK
jgi:hypothetical protein